MADENNKEKTIELKSNFAVIEIPVNAVEMVINTTVFHEGELINVKTKYSMSEIKDAFHKAEMGYIDDDAEFELTDKGRAVLDLFNNAY